MGSTPTPSNPVATEKKIISRRVLMKTIIENSSRHINDVLEQWQKLRDCMNEAMSDDVETSRNACDKIWNEAPVLAAKLDQVSGFFQCLPKFVSRYYANRNTKKDTAQRAANWEVESSIDYQMAGIYADPNKYF